MRPRTVFPLLLVLAVVSSASGQEWARKMFKNKSHDFGTVARDSKVEHVFELTNIYLEDVHIASVRSSCSCTTPRIQKEWLKTYEKGAIVAHYNTDRFLGSKGATITVTIDKPFYAEVQLHVKGNIRSDVVFNPGSVQFGSVDEGVAVEKRVAVSSTKGTRWQVSGVESSNPHVSATILGSRRSGRYMVYDLAVKLSKTAPAGYIRNHLTLVTNDYQSKQIPLLVEGVVEPSITVSPASLFMGVVPSGQRITKKLVVRGKQPFRILDVTCDDESFEFETTSNGKAKKVHIVPVTFVAGEGVGKIAKTIRIQTDLGEMVPELDAYAVVSK